MEVLRENPMLLAVVGLGVGYVLMRLNKKIDDKQMEAIRGAGKLRALGLERIPDVLDMVAVGDFTGAVKATRTLFVDLHDNDKRRLEFGKVWRAITEEGLKDPETRDRLIKAFDDMRRQHAPDTLPKPAPAGKPGAAADLGPELVS